MISRKSLKKSDNGVVGIVVALLLIGLVISAIAFVQAVFVPKWMAESESEHMEEVAKQFSQLKFATDTLAMTDNTYSSISCPITLGNKEMPFLFSARTYGDLEILPNDYMMVFNLTEGNETISLDSIKYTSHNAYYINQNFVYENGAIILNQQSGDTIKIAPSIDISTIGGDIPIITMYTMTFNEVGGKTVASGYGTYPVQAKKAGTENYKWVDVGNLTIYNSHLEAWSKYLNSTFTKSLLLNFTIDNASDEESIKIQFLEGDGYHLPEIRLYLSIIDVKITPGWIE